VLVVFARIPGAAALLADGPQQLGLGPISKLTDEPEHVLVLTRFGQALRHCGHGEGRLVVFHPGQ
jgi:hypothetical protein